MVEMQAFEACDNISDSQVIGTVKASVPDGQPLTYRLTDNAGGLFEIGEDNGELSLVSGRTLDYTMATQHTITVLVSNTVAIEDTSTANFQINVNTTPLLGSNNYVFTYSSNVSVMLNNRGQAVESFTLSTNLPTGLTLVNNDGQLSLEGTPRQVTLVTISTLTNHDVRTDEILSAVDIGPYPIGMEVANKCGSNGATLGVTVNPAVFISGDLSPNIVAESNAAAISNNENYLNETYLMSNLPFASGGTGTYEDPILIGVAPESTNLGFVLDYRGTRIPPSAIEIERNVFYFRLLIKPGKGLEQRITLITETAGVNRQILPYGVGPNSPNRLQFRSFSTPGDLIPFGVSGDGLEILYSVDTGVSHFRAGENIFFETLTNGRLRFDYVIYPPAD